MVGDGGTESYTWYIDPDVNSWRKIGSVIFQSPYIDDFKSVMEISSSTNSNIRKCVRAEFGQISCTVWATHTVSVNITISQNGIINVTNNPSGNSLKVTDIKLYSSNTNRQLSTNDQTLLSKLAILKTKNLKNTKQKLTDYKSQRKKLENQLG